MNDHEKLIEKLAKIRAHQESAEKIGSEAEAQAFGEMLQRLLAKHKLGMSDLDFANLDKTEPVTTQVVDGTKYDPEWHPADSRKVWIEKLAMSVAKAHFCKILVQEYSGKITLVGRKSDIEICEYVLVVLDRTVRRLVEIETDKYCLEQFNRKLSRTRKGTITERKDFRHAFLDGFVLRITERYEEERRKQQGEPTALVRFNASEKAVEDFLDSLCTRPARMVKYKPSHNAEGWARGMNMANGVDLRGNGIKAPASRKALR